MTTPQANTTFLVRRLRFLPESLFWLFMGLVTLAIPIVSFLVHQPLIALLMLALPMIMFLMAVPPLTMLFRHNLTGITLRDGGLYVNVWPYALGTVPYDNIAECRLEDLGAQQVLILRLKDFNQIGDDLPVMLRKMRNMRAIMKKQMKFSRLIFEDDLKEINAAITARLALAISPASSTPELETPVASPPAPGDLSTTSPTDTQYSVDKKLGISYLVLGTGLVGIPALIFIKGWHTLFLRMSFHNSAPFLVVIALFLPTFLGSLFRVFNKKPAVILMAQGLYDNAWLYPLGAVPWHRIARCQMCWHRGPCIYEYEVSGSFKTLHVAFSSPEELLKGLSWAYCLGRRASYFFNILDNSWKDIQIPQYAVAADLDILKQEIERRLAATRAAAPQEADRG